MKVVIAHLRVANFDSAKGCLCGVCGVTMFLFFSCCRSEMFLSTTTSEGLFCVFCFCFGLCFSLCFGCGLSEWCFVLGG